ncbi:Pr6Pr family membrane protein [Leucobacter sp. M11]|uniref:Pr6Pr family membrane protein n=1 Tax=Leucobacter sp. M11 TaxID=2993565 RepID=UPI002D7F235D|nr:Pr6Pr family membrane protein [Leucobacter sp. M11]MEB4615868.1 Pr6Pr family membrane protein [Leucobacter sp. M11]
MRPALLVLRFGTAAAIIAAIVAQLVRSLGVWAERGDQRIDIDVLNFFSFFTIQSNILGAVALTIGGVSLARRATPPRWAGTLMLLAATCLVTTGVVYNTLLRGIELPQGATVGWSNEILHVFAPALILLDWLLAARALGHPGPGPKSLAVVVAYPLVWLTVTMLRGPRVFDEGTGNSFWYPYPFLNPNHDGGYGLVAIYGVGIAAVILGAAFALRWAAKRLSRAAD